MIEDWELFADPKEIERRKAERKRQAMPLQERQQILASEWVEARSRAARAKSANDKSQQKAMGQVIRNLKLEMAQLGDCYKCSMLQLRSPSPGVASVTMLLSWLSCLFIHGFSGLC